MTKPSLFSLIRALSVQRTKNFKLAAMLLAIAGAAVVGLGAVQNPQQYQGKTENPHGPLKIPCERCHTTTSWKPIRPFPDFNHATTRYPLKGMHKRVDCMQCHINPIFSEVGGQCADCHADIHRRQLGSDCEQCHSDRDWRNVARHVNGHENRFPLLGAHVAVECESCHKSAAVGLFRGLSTDCVFCHNSDFLNAQSVNHVAAGFSTQCQTCHGFDSWAVSVFDHNALTSFALTGAHTQLACTQCHIGGNFTNAPTTCVGCHLPDYNNTTDPNHAQAGFPTDCSLCHSTASWSGATFNHNNTAFPLTGAHVALQCPACHGNGIYAGLPTTCVSCHLADFNGTTNPNHVSSNFPQDCTICHNTTAWSPSIFDHNNTAFPLTGAHTTVPCANCHIGGVYAGTPTDCYSCHSADYNNTTDPNHAAAGFPKTCQDCHTTASWSGATFNHTQFPIYSGTHTFGVWTSCSDCHPNSSDYSVFSCILCHTHDQATTDPQHTGVANYVYNATSCYSCHPNGTTN